MFGCSPLFSSLGFGVRVLAQGHGDSCLFQGHSSCVVCLIHH